MDPGELRHRVALFTSSVAAAAGAGSTPTDTPIATVWGSLATVGDRSRIGTVQRGESATHRVTIRYRSDVDASKWLTVRGRKMRVIGIRDPDELGVYLELSCVEERDA